MTKPLKVVVFPFPPVRESKEPYKTGAPFSLTVPESTLVGTLLRFFLALSLPLSLLLLVLESAAARIFPEK